MFRVQIHSPSLNLDERQIFLDISHYLVLQLSFALYITNSSNANYIPFAFMFLLEITLAPVWTQSLLKGYSTQKWAFCPQVVANQKKLLKISSFVFSRRKKLTQVWNNLRWRFFGWSIPLSEEVYISGHMDITRTQSRLITNYHPTLY